MVEKESDAHETTVSVVNAGWATNPANIKRTAGGRQPHQNEANASKCWHCRCQFFKPTSVQPAQTEERRRGQTMSIDRALLIPAIVSEEAAIPE